MAVMLAAWGTAARAQTVRDDLHITNGTVNAQVLSGTTLYVGGSFTHVGPVTGSGAPVDSATGVAVPGFPRIEGFVNAVVSDGAGGWYVGGQFSTVGGQARSNLARVLADLSLSPWNPGADGVVRTLALEAGVVYVGGDFTSVSGQARSRLAAVDTSAGAPTAWNPGVDGSVRVLRRLGATLIVGGLFTSVGGQPRNRIAAVDTGTALATAWNPNANSGVLALELDGGTVYAGGQFTSIGGQARSRIAALDAVTGAATAWNPGANNQVFAIALAPGVVFVGGQFATAGSMPRARIAALDAVTGLATPWDAGAGNIVRALAVDGPSLYAGGDFLSIGGQARSRVAELSVSTGAATPWDPVAYGIVSAIGLDGPNVFVGGTFNGIGGLRRNNLAAFDLATGQATAWDPDVDDEVLGLGMRSGVVYAGGSFTSVSGQPRPFAAALDSTLGLPNAWNAGLDGPVSALVIGDSTVYVGGLFGAAGGQPRANLAELDAGTGLATPWNPGTNNQVFALARSGSRVYVGGSFSTAGGQPRANLAAIDAATGLATPWNPGSNGTVRAIADACDRIYVGGFFTMIGASARAGVAAIDPVAALPTAWNPSPDGPVLGFALHQGLAYVCGVFSSIGGQPRNRIAAIDPATALATGWNPDCNGTLRVLTADDGWIYAGGSFSAMGGQSSGNLAGITEDAGYACPPMALTPPPLAVGVAGEPYMQVLDASGGTGPWCFRVTAGALPAGLALSSAGAISGTPLAAGASAFTVTASDARGCTGSADYTLSVFAAPAAAAIGPSAGGLCLTPADPCVTVPFRFTRLDSTPVRAVSVTFQLAPGALALCTPGSPSTSVRPGTWLDAHPNSVFQVVDDGAGSYTVDLALIGAPCGITTGGELFVADVQATGGEGAHPVTVTAVRVRDCANAPVAVNPGSPDSVRVLGTPIVVTPSLLPPAPAGLPYAQALVASAGTPPLAFALTAGSLPGGMTMDPDGEVAGTPDSLGTWLFEVTVTDAGGCRGVTACTLAVVCPALAVLPDTLPDAVAGQPYELTFDSAGGFPPYAFAVGAGAPPAGLVLSPAGVLSGTPFALGVHVFEVTVGDSAGCTGARACTLSVVCPAIAVQPPVLADGVVAAAYADTLTAAGGIAPFAWAVTSDSLPTGLVLDPATGAISGTPLVAGARHFTVTATDSLGCSGNRSYTMSVFATPPGSFVAAVTESLCLSAGQPCATVPFVFERAETTPAIGVSVTFELDTAKLALCTPGDPLASIRPGPWLDAYPNASFQVTDLGGGRYTVDHVLLGAPCGMATGGIVFTADVAPAGGDGLGTLTVTHVRARDCSNFPIAAAPGPPATLPIDNTPPPAIADLVATAVPAGNGAGPTVGVALTWTAPDSGTVALYRASLGSYPLYDALGPVAPPDPGAAPGPPWTLVAADAAPGLVDAAAPRGFWHYVAIVTNRCGVASASSNMTNGTLDYVLGDVSDGATAGLGDNRVATEDVSLLGAHYGIGADSIAARGVAYLDVGPTVGAALDGRPLPDQLIDFEDLAVFAGNYESSAQAPLASARRAGGSSASADRVALSAPSSATAGERLTATLRMAGTGRVRAFSARLAWDPAVVEPLATTPLGFVESRGGIVLVPRPGTVDAAVLGLRRGGLSGEGEVAAIAFRVLRAGDPAIRIERVIARDAGNRDVPVTLGAAAPAAGGQQEAPAATALLAPPAHPLRGGGTLAFALARGGPVELALYAVDGRLVRTLAASRFEAGVHRVDWDGRDGHGRPVAPGVYFARLAVEGRQYRRTIVLIE